MDDIIEHHGVKGQRWGVRRKAKKDAKRFADAKMYYGKGAGTRRKLLNAELNKKKKDIPGYEQAFNDQLKNVNYAKSAKKATKERKVRDTAHKTRMAAKQFTGITGSLAVGAASLYYSRNKQQVDSIISNAASKVVSGVTNQRNKAVVSQLFKNANKTYGR